MTREHLVQSVAIIVGIIIASIPGIWFLANDIASVRADVMVLSAKQVASEERIGAFEKVEGSHNTDDVAFRTEMRTAINAMISALADVRVAIGVQRYIGPSKK